ncbi:peptidogalycan biosysnthesis protein, partial [Acinetobacter baumannii]
MLARDATARAKLVQAARQWCMEEDISSLHLLFAADEDIATCADQGLMLRHTVQFHWQNTAPVAPVVSSEATSEWLAMPNRFTSFDDF